MCSTEHSIKHCSDRLLCQFQSRAKFPTPYFVTKEQFSFFSFGFSSLTLLYLVSFIFDINIFLMPVSSVLFRCKNYFFRRNYPYVFVYSMTITNWAEIWEWFSIKGSLYTKTTLCKEKRRTWRGETSERNMWTTGKQRKRKRVYKNGENLFSVKYVIANNNTCLQRKH